MTNKMAKKRTRISIETHEITIIRTSGKPQNGFCKSCQAVVPVLTPEKTASFLQTTVSEVCHLLEIEMLHLTNVQRGVALICGNSLQENKKLFKNNKE